MLVRRYSLKLINQIIKRVFLTPSIRIVRQEEEEFEMLRETAKDKEYSRQNSCYPPISISETYVEA